MDDLKAEHASSLQEQVSSLEKKISNQALELKATQDDLAKAKAALEASRIEVAKLTSQRDEATSAIAAASADSPIQAEEIARLTKELSHTKDDLAAMTEMLSLTKASLTEVSNNQTKELEAAAQARADEVTKIRAVHAEEVTQLVTQKSELSMRLSDLEGEMATMKATAAAEQPAPKVNGNGAPHAPPSNVSKEDLQRLHEAHNLKIHDLQASYDKALEGLKFELEATRAKADELKAELEHKGMEMRFYENNQEENEDLITRYVRFFGVKSFVGAMVALAVVYGFI